MFDTDSLRASARGKEIVDRARRRQGWTKTCTAAWWQIAHTSRATLRRFWLGKPIQRDNFIAICAAVGISNWSEIADTKLVPESERTVLADWGEAPELDSFYGRTAELNQLEEWISQDRCKVIALLGLGGIGKTTLGVMLADQIQEQFEVLIWRSLKGTQSIQSLLSSLLSVLSSTQVVVSTEEIARGISQLIEYLRQRRCLIILDEAEVIFASDKSKSRPGVGRCREGYEGYGELLRRVSIDRHQSCIVLTSREKPQEIAVLQGENLPVRSLPLKGLQSQEAIEIFQAKGYSGSESGLTELIALYGGNPLALKAIATMIQEVFDGNVAEFLSQSTLVLGDRLRTLLQQQFNRLCELEKELVYWLAIEREPVSLSRLQANLHVPPAASFVVEALASLERRSLLEKVMPVDRVLYALQPLVMKYVTEELIEQVLDEIDAVLETQNIEHFQVFRNHSLVKPNAPSNPDDRSAYQVLARLVQSLQREFRSESNLESHLLQIHGLLRKRSPLAVGYAGRNLRILFKALKIDSSNSDWQDIPMR